MIKEKTCTKCGRGPAEVEFRLRNLKTGRVLDRFCVECRSSNGRLQTQRLKFETMCSYGGPQCACCGEDEFEFLAIDHVDGGGNEHRRSLGGDGTKRFCGIQFYLWLKRSGWPPGYRVLCHNCNFSIGAYGYCPHHEPSRIDRLNLLRGPRQYNRGVRNCTSKLTEEVVLDIRRLRTNGVPVSTLVEKYSVAKSQIYKICSGKSWSHVPPG